MSAHPTAAATSIVMTSGVVLAACAGAVPRPGSVVRSVPEASAR